MADYTFATLLKDTPASGQMRARLPAAGDRGVASGPLQINAGALASSVSALGISITWGGGGTHTGLLVDVTDTSSASDSKPLDIRVGGLTKFNVRKDGFLSGTGATLSSSTITEVLRINQTAYVSSGIVFSVSPHSESNTAYVSNFGGASNYPGLGATSAWCRFLSVGVSSASSANFINVVDAGISFSNGSSSDVWFGRQAPNTLAQRNGANAQAFQVYNKYTDASNYERGAVAWSANEFLVGTEKAGTGASRTTRVFGEEVVFQIKGAGGAINFADTSGTNKAALYPDQPNVGFYLNALPILMVEQSAPSAPSTGRALTFLQDNGSGKTQLCVRFATGAVQVLATEP